MEEAWLFILLKRVLGTARGGAHASTVAGVRKEEARGVMIRISHLSVLYVWRGSATHVVIFALLN